jgi:GNAT superfamily N-acetyltransferase
MTGDISIQTHRELDDASLDTLAALDRDIFPEPFSREQIERELRWRSGLCILFAVRASAGGPGASPIVCGYKVGYEMTAQIFFSYLGGVRAEFRGQGIASQLMAEQHRIARELGYSIVRTHTHNEFRSMLLLNIKSGFDVTGVNYKSGARTLSIILEKVLAAAPEPQI